MSLNEQKRSQKRSLAYALKKSKIKLYFKVETLVRFLRKRKKMF